MPKRKRIKSYYVVGGKRVPVVMNDSSNTIKYKNPNYVPPELPKKSKSEFRSERISSYSQAHNVKREYIEQCISRYLELYPDKISSAGNENCSNRFISTCLKEFRNKALPLPHVAELSDDELIFLLLLIWWDEKSRKVTSFSRYYELWRIEVLEAIIYYLSLHPDKIFSEGCENVSDRFLRSCVRHNPKLSQKMRERGIDI